jgi:predicted lipoprotein with Yx(FWY)xxD motif
VNRIYLTIATLALGLAVAVAGCGGSSDSNGESAYGGSESTAANETAKSESSSGGGAAATIAVASVGDLGKVLVDSKGFTLYYFKKDQGGKSACYGACAEGWPPLTTEGTPKGMGGVQASMLGASKRKDGTTQVTYAGWPLYTYVVDKKPGEANGNDIDAFGGEWYALHANGEKAE